MHRGLIVAVVFLTGCPSEPAPAPIEGTLEAEWTLGDPVSCSNPGDAFTQLEEGAAAVGVDRVVPDAADFWIPGHFLVGVLAYDVDADGDLDLSFNRPDGSHDLYVNDGGGTFAFVPALRSPPGTPEVDPHAQGFADVDGDGLPEFFESSFNGLGMRRATGVLEWEDAVLVWDARGTQYEDAGWNTFTAGDVDGDGDLDIVLASVHGAFDPFGETDEPPPGEAELILLGDGTGGFAEPIPLISAAGEGMSQLVLLTDRDADGDVDIFVGADLVGPMWPPGTLFDNGGMAGDGTLRLTDIGEETGTALRMSHMGGDSADLNGDGALDYCFSDIGPVVCLESDPSGVYVDTEATRNLVPGPMDIDNWWTGWSLEITDLDNDGYEDLVVAGGRADAFIESENPTETPWESDQPNGIWQSNSDGVWEDRTDQLGFGSIKESYGLTTADLDGDGALEVIIGNEKDAPSIWWNTCSAGAWLRIDLHGTPGNVDAFGATVLVEHGDRTWIQEVYSLRTVGQAPPWLHFGLGAVDTVDRITVRWPGGETSVKRDVPTRRTVVVTHPDAG